MWIVAMVVIAFSASASAFAAGDFANNAVTELAPLIALFGEQVTTQFLNSSFTVLDSILFAMAPIGVLTAISAAIRVGGSSRLKALIGKARESEESVEAELLSSTSKDVCEIWNGQELVRVQKDGGVLQIVYQEPQEPQEPEEPEEPEEPDESSSSESVSPEDLALAALAALESM
jgi:hypothetical protein